MQVDVRIEGLERLRAGVAAGPPTLAREARTAMDAGSKLIVGTARSLAPRDRGRLAESIDYELSGSGASLTSRIGPRQPYGIVVEQGRRAGKPPPPVAALRPWARRHGIPDSAVYVVARAIGRRGIKARPFMQPALEQNQARVAALFARVGLAVVQRMAA